MENSRDLFSSHGSAGKGDRERSSGWRDRYDLPPSGDMTGWRRVGPSKWRKVYGASRAAVQVVDLSPPRVPVLDEMAAFAAKDICAVECPTLQSENLAQFSGPQARKPTSI
jgi:hypothetical protein